MDNVQYIKMLSGDNGLPITQELMENWSKFETKTEINKVFFKLLADTPKDQIKIPQIPDKIKATLEKLYNNQRTAKLEVLEKGVKADLKYFDDYYTNAQAYLLAASKKRQEIRLFEGKNQIIEESIAKATNNPFWVLSDNSDRIFPDDFELNFRTSGEVILRYVNKEHKIDQTVNFGYFNFTWHMANNSLKLEPATTKFSIGSYAHPHVKVNGYVCLGNASEMYKNALVRGDIATILEVYQAILTSYNPESPFVPLQHFWLMQNPQSVQDTDCIYDLAPSDYWYDTRELKTSFEPRANKKETDNGIEFEVVQLYTYIKKHKELNFRVGTDVYYKANNGKMILATKEMIYEY